MRAKACILLLLCFFNKLSEARAEPACFEGASCQDCLGKGECSWDIDTLSCVNACPKEGESHCISAPHAENRLTADEVIETMCEATTRGQLGGRSSSKIRTLKDKEDKEETDTVARIIITLEPTIAATEPPTVSPTGTPTPTVTPTKSPTRLPTASPSSSPSLTLKKIMDEACNDPLDVDGCKVLCGTAQAECCFADPTSNRTCSSMEIDVDCEAYDACGLLYDTKPMVDAACLGRDLNDLDTLDECLTVCEGTECCFAKDEISKCLDGRCHAFQSCGVLYYYEFWETASPTNASSPAATQPPPPQATNATSRAPTSSPPTSSPTPIQCSDQPSCKACLESSEDCGWESGQCATACAPGGPCITYSLLTAGQETAEPLKENILNTFCAQFDDDTSIPGASISDYQLPPGDDLIPESDEGFDDDTVAGNSEAHSPCTSQASCNECLAPTETSSTCGWTGTRCVDSCPPGVSCVTMELLTLGQSTADEVLFSMLYTACSQINAFVGGSAIAEEIPVDSEDLSTLEVLPEDSVAIDSTRRECSERTSCQGCLGTAGKCGWTEGSLSCVDSCPPGEACMTLALLTIGQESAGEVLQGIVSTACAQIAEAEVEPPPEEETHADQSPPEVQTEGEIHSDGELQPAAGTEVDTDSPIQCADQNSCNHCLLAGRDCGWVGNGCVDSCPLGESCVTMALLTGGNGTPDEVQKEILYTACSRIDAFVGGPQDQQAPQHANNENDQSGEEEQPQACSEITSCSGCLEGAGDCGWEGGTTCVPSCSPGQSCVTLSLLTGGQNSGKNVQENLLNAFCAQFQDSDCKGSHSTAYVRTHGCPPKGQQPQNGVASGSAGGPDFGPNWSNPGADDNSGVSTVWLFKTFLLTGFTMIAM